MGGRMWTAEEEADLATLSLDEFMQRWGRTRLAALARREKLHLSNSSEAISEARMSSTGFPVRQGGTPLCAYCSTRQGPCTCEMGDRCRDSLCAYGPKRKNSRVA